MSRETIIWLGLLYGPIVSGFGAVSVWCYTHYKLSRARHQEILADLSRVRPTRAAGAAVEDG